MATRYFRLAAALTAIAWLTGCATSRSVVEPGVVTSANPAQGIAVRIAKVEDARSFRIAPGTPDVPSLSDDDVGNSATTSRAIARKRNTFGKALGDVLLPEGQTVAGLTGSAVAQALRESGYRVLAPGEPGYEEAVPVSARVQQCWAWMTPGFWALTLEQRTEVSIQAPLKPLADGVTVSGRASESMQLATEGSWTDIVSKGLADLVRNLKTRLASN